MVTLLPTTIDKVTVVLEKYLTMLPVFKKNALKLEIAVQ